MRAREIVASLRAFAAERAPVGVVASLAPALSAGPWALARGDGLTLLKAAAVVFLVLLALRIVDDLRSLEHDRITHPDRALPAGRIAAGPLAAGAALLYGGAVLVSAPHLTLGLALLAAYYAAYYAVAERIPLVVRPPLANAVFLAIPPGVGLLAGEATRSSAATSAGGAGASALAALAVCFWLSAVGHDFAHEVHAPDEAPPGPPTISQRIGSRATAMVGLACYAAGCVAGLVAARGARAPGGWPPLFVASLVILYGYVGILLVRLVARPSRERARRFYVSGVVCFALPSLLLGLDRLLGW